MPVRVACTGKRKEVTARWAVEQKLSGSFFCAECQAEVFLKPCTNGFISPHFSHYHEGQGGGGGGCGESSQHKEAKVEFVLGLYEWHVSQHCAQCRQSLSISTFTTDDYSAVYEHRMQIEGHLYIVDVAIMRGGKLEAVVEILHTHAMESAKYEALKRVCEHVFEVKASDVLENVKTHQLQSHGLVTCDVCKRKALSGRAWRQAHPKHRKCWHCGRWKEDPLVKHWKEPRWNFLCTACAGQLCKWCNGNDCLPKSPLCSMCDQKVRDVEIAVRGVAVNDDEWWHINRCLSDYRESQKYRTPNQGDVPEDFLNALSTVVNMGEAQWRLSRQNKKDKADEACVSHACNKCAAKVLEPSCCELCRKCSQLVRQAERALEHVTAEDDWVHIDSCLGYYDTFQRYRCPMHVFSQEKRRALEIVVAQGKQAWEALLSQRANEFRAKRKKAKDAVRRRKARRVCDFNEEKHRENERLCMQWQLAR